jgi:hypothetical protein
MGRMMMVLGAGPNIGSPWARGSKPKRYDYRSAPDIIRKKELSAAEE